ncbi:50 kDa hatching enzyme-like [Patiria miniata]|uniref:Peptidase metallopeptidase domain-containing protein n=1 Tax=Patiria miniata TaxID=46514 RepID=A0A914A994_PATMI|nr:50 kDa hatching enzyme-like [Patiria miniata]
MSRLRRLPVILLLFCVWVAAVKTQADDSAVELDQQMTDLQNYLERNGYLNVNGTDTDGNLTQAIIDLQTMTGLEPTGQVDDFLLDTLHSPRCGMADLVPEEYRVHSVKHSKNQLTYWIEQFPPSMDQELVRTIIRDAFQVWADVTPLSFSEVFGSQADIRIIFGAREHGDGAPFDGPGGVLAHAYLPLRSDAHFDAEERWTAGTFQGTNLFQVAAHEFGHSLGLFHSEDLTALMYPYYSGYQTEFRLSEDDKEGIRSLYGREVTVPDDDDTDDENDDIVTTPAEVSTQLPPTTAGTPGPPSPPPPAACLRNGTFDAVVNTIDGHKYGFIGAYVWCLDVFPRTYTLINEAWENLPNYVHAAVTRGNITYILKDCYVWSYENRAYLGRRRIREQWPGLPCNVQAGYTSGSDGFTYFFKGIFVYRFRGSALNSRRRIWTWNWQGLPDRNLRVTAVCPNLNNAGDAVSVYMFTGNVYYLFDDSLKHFVYPRQYPRAVNRFILDDCPSS